MHQIKVIFRRRRKTTILGPEVCPDERGDRKVIAPQPGSRINGPHRASMKHGWSQILNNGGEVWFRARRKRSPASGVGEWFLWCLRKAVCVRGCIRVYVCVCIYIYMCIYIYVSYNYNYIMLYHYTMTYHDKSHSCRHVNFQHQGRSRISHFPWSASFE